MSAKAKYIWMDGEMLPWEEAKVRVMHALHYGSVFEGSVFMQRRMGWRFSGFKSISSDYLIRPRFTVCRLIIR